MADSVATMTTTLDGSGVAAGARIITKSMLDIITSTNSAKTAMASLDSQASRFGRGGLSAINALRGGVDHLKTSTSGLRHMFKTIEERIIRIGATLAVFAGMAAAIGLVVGSLKEAFTYMSLMETANLGIASSFLVVGNYYDEMTGKQLTAQKSFITAQRSSAEAIEMLKVANLKTIATLDELVQGFQIALPVALRKGFDTKMVVDFTTAVYQMAGAIGQPFDQMSEEIRSLLGQANITKHSRMAQVLGLQAGTAIRKEFDKVKNNGKELYAFMMDLVKPFEMAGQASQKTWEGVLSNIKDIGKIGLATAFDKVFDGAKETAFEIQSIFGEINNDTLSFDWNPKFIQGAKDIGDSFKEIFDELKNSILSGANKASTGFLLEELRLVGNVVLTITQGFIAAFNPIMIFVTSLIAFRTALMAVKAVWGLLVAVTRASTISITQENVVLAQLGLTQQARISQAQSLLVTERAKIQASAVAATAAINEITIAKEKLLIERLHSQALVQNAELEITSATKSQAASQNAAGGLYKKAFAQRLATAEAVRAVGVAEKELITAQKGAAAMRSKVSTTMAVADAERVLAHAKGLVIIRSEEATAAQVRHTAALRLSLAANKEVEIATRALHVAKVQQISTDYGAVLAAERYNAVLLKQGIQVGLVTSAQITKRQIDWLAATDAERNIILLRAETVAWMDRTRAIEAAGLAARTTAASVGFLGKAFTAVGGWLTVVTAALLIGAWAWGKYGDAAEKAREKAITHLQDVNEITAALDRQIESLKAKKAIELEDKGGTPATHKEKIVDLLGSDYEAYQKDMVKVAGDMEHYNNLKAKYDKSASEKYRVFLLKDMTATKKQFTSLLDAWKGVLAKKKELSDVTNANYKTGGNEVVDEKAARQAERDASSKATLDAQLISESLAGHKQKMKTQLAIEKDGYAKGIIAVTDYYKNIKRIRLEELDSRRTIADADLMKASVNVKSAESSNLDNKNQKLNDALTAESKARQKVEELKAEAGTINADKLNNETKDLKKQEIVYGRLQIELMKTVGAYSALAVAKEASFKNTEIRTRVETELISAEEAGAELRIKAAMDALTALNALEDYKEEVGAATDKKNERLASAYDENPYVEEMKRVKILHDYKMEVLEAEMAARKEGSLETASTQKKIDNEVAKSARKTYELTLSEAQKYTGKAATMFYVLADAQDDQTREGFEAAKSYNTAAVIMATATAIMNQLAIPGPVGWAGAAMAAVTGAVQLGSVLSTSFDGGGSISQPGDFSASGGGGGTGTVLGDSTATTQSIGNSNDLLERIHAEEYEELQDITYELRRLNQGFIGVASSLMRAGGMAVDDSYQGYSSNPHISLPLDFLSGITNSITNGLFGKTTKKLVGSGLSFGDANLGDILGGEDVDVRAYQDIKTKKKSWFSSSSSIDTNYSDIDNMTQDLFNDLFMDLGNTLVYLAEGLGVDVQRVYDQTLDIGKVDLKGLTGDELAEKMQEVFSYAGDKAAEGVFESLVLEYQKINEGALDAIVRLLVEKVIVSSSLEMIGQEGFGEDEFAGDMIVLSQALIEAAGGLDAFMESIANFYEGFTSTLEKNLDLQKGLEASLANIGMELPNTRDGFADLVTSIDLTQYANLDQVIVSRYEAALKVVNDEAAADLAKYKSAASDAFIGLFIGGGSISSNTSEGVWVSTDVGTVSGDADTTGGGYWDYGEPSTSTYDTYFNYNMQLKDYIGMASDAALANLDIARDALNIELARYDLLKETDDEARETYARLIELSEAANEYYSAIEAGMEAYYQGFKSSSVNLMRLRGSIITDVQDTDSLLVDMDWSTILGTSSQIFEAYMDAGFAGLDPIMAFIAEDVAEYFATVKGMEDSYRTNSAYFSEEEVEAYQKDEISKVLGEVGLVLPGTVAGFRDLLESLDQTTEMGLLQYLTMLEVADASASYYDAVGEAAKSFKELTLEAIDIQLAATRALKNLYTGNLTTLSPEDKYYQSKALFEAQKDAALSGDMEAAEGLPAVITEFLTDSQSYYASGENYVADFNEGISILEMLSGMDPGSSSQLELIQEQIDGLTELKDAVSDGAIEQINLLRQQVELTGYTNTLLTMYLNELNGIPNDGALPTFGGGSPYIPYDMDASIHEGEMVIDRASAEALRKYGIKVQSDGSDNKGVEERLDKVVDKLGDMERRLSNIDQKARLVANS